MSRFYSHNILPCKTKETSHFYRKLYLIADAELKYFWTKIKCWERKMLTTLFSGRSVCLMTAKHEKVSFWFLIFATKTRNFSNWRWFMASPNKVTVKLVTNHFVVLLPIWVAEAESLTTSVSTRMFSIKKCSPSTDKRNVSSWLPIILTLRHGSLPVQHTSVSLSLYVVTPYFHHFQGKWVWLFLIFVIVFPVPGRK